jgi:hypothetical protein
VFGRRGRRGRHGGTFTDLDRDHHGVALADYHEGRDGNRPGVRDGTHHGVRDGDANE